MLAIINGQTAGLKFFEGTLEYRRVTEAEFFKSFFLKLDFFTGNPGHFS